MKAIKLLALASVLAVLPQVQADGDPEFVALPADYQNSFTHYATMNRDGKPQLAKMYANEVAVASYRDDQQADSGSIVVMEIYQTKKDKNDQPVVGVDGNYEAGDLAAIAVMERAEQWDAGYPAEHRLQGWGFAIYNPDGSPKQNDLPCVACHTPLDKQDYLFSFDRLSQYVQQH